MNEILEALRRPAVWQALLIAGITAVVLPVWHHLFPKPHHMQMGWMDWCGYYACIGVIFIMAGGTVGWMGLMAAGMFLLLPLYPLAILGILGKLDDVLMDIVRFFRRR